MGTLTLRIDEKLERNLEQIAKAKGRTKSDVVREMLRKATTLELFHEACRRAIPYAEKAGYLTDEDICRDFSRGSSSTPTSFLARS